MNQTQQLLCRSIEIYRDIIEITGRLAEELHTNTHEELQKAIAGLQGLQQDAAQVDTLLAAAVCDTSSRTGELFAARREMIKKCIRQNKLLSPRIHGMMAVISSELSQIKNGRTAMTGYRSFSTQGKRGQNVCHSS